MYAGRVYHQGPSVPISPHRAAAHDANAPADSVGERTARSRRMRADEPPRRARELPHLALWLRPAGATAAPTRHEARASAIALGGFSATSGDLQRRIGSCVARCRLCAQRHNLSIARFSIGKWGRSSNRRSIWTLSPFSSRRFRSFFTESPQPHQIRPAAQGCVPLIPFTGGADNASGGAGNATRFADTRAASHSPQCSIASMVGAP